MAAVKCPSCNRQLEVEAEYRDWTVRCPHCEHEFVPNDVREAEARATTARAAGDATRMTIAIAIARRDRDDRDDDRRSEPDGVPDDVREEALQLVAGPGCGWKSAAG